MDDDSPSRHEFDALTGRVDVLQHELFMLKSDVAEIKGLLPNLATKADVSVMGERLGSKIDDSVNGLLKDALASVPAKVTIWFAAISAFAVFIGAAATILQLLK